MCLEIDKNCIQEKQERGKLSLGESEVEMK